jgi:hypothetical protein
MEMDQSAEFRDGRGMIVDAESFSFR